MIQSNQIMKYGDMMEFNPQEMGFELIKQPTW